MNRFRVPPPGAEAPPSEADATEAIARDGLKLEEDAASRLVHAHADAVKLASLDALHVKALDGRARGKVPIVRVPELASDVHDLVHLGEVAEVLMRGGV